MVRFEFNGPWRASVVCLVAGVVAGVVTGASGAPAGARPNVILVITDDQGYGDLAAHGNPMLETPNLDRLYGESIRLTNFHVDPTCSPTRSALMSGRYSTRTGVWHTIAGRSLMAGDELTLAEIFRASGYRTAQFGKWHLGDAFPLRPQDQGFEEAFYHGGGGVGQTPDYWGNDYFDDHYFHEGDPTAVEGYCTDVWFAAARDYIRKHQHEPFFVYLSTNAPHGPYHVAERYRRPYAAAGNPTDHFLGMIANIDQNMGDLLGDLDALGLSENTLLIFMTDNGTAQGERVFNAGMRGKKGSPYDGGHRVPCFWRWPDGELGGESGQGRDVDQLTAHVDLRPTLVELCGLTEPPGPESDGASLVKILRGDQQTLRDRTLFVHSQRILDPIKWRKTAVMTDRWRLVDGHQLFDIRRDAAQQANVASHHPKVVEQLRVDYDRWWESLADARRRTVYVQVGSDQQPVVDLTAHDWLIEVTPWNQGMITKGPWINGPWAVEVLRPGLYEFTLSRWPLHLNRPLEATSARLTIQGHDRRCDVSETDNRAVFSVELKAGESKLQGYLSDNQGRTRGPYYVRIRRSGRGNAEDSPVSSEAEE